MFFQKVIKGISGITYSDATKVVDEGIMCNWWRAIGTITPAKVKEQLTEANALLHLNHYNQGLPSGHPYEAHGSTYGDVSPFISTTAGAIQRDDILKRNILFDPFMTALRFATKNYKSNGFLFYSYLITLGKKAIELEQFAEDVRELHIYQDFLPYHKQGEVMAKIIIPSVQIEFAMEYDGPGALTELKAGRTPSPVSKITNASYLPPEKFSNIKELLK